MIKWFADRLAHQGSEVRKDERGFTLIELLVVVIIIGILAAIAIPTFLNQRENAQQASLETDARNAATQVQSWGTEQNGDYSDIDGDPFAADGEYEVTWSTVGGTANGFTSGPTAAGESDEGFTFTVNNADADLEPVTYDSTAGGIQQ